MKKKSFVILLAVMILVTFMPTAAFGASTVNPGGASTYMQNLKIAKAGRTLCPKNAVLRHKVRHTEDELEYIKQMLLEEKTMYMEEMPDQKYFCPEVWEAIIACGNEYEQSVMNAESLEDLCEIFGGWIFLNEDIMEPLYAMEYLGELTIQQVESADDLDRLVDELKTKLKDSCATYKKKDYTDYYWSKFQDEKAETEEQIAEIKTFKDYAYFWMRESDLIDYYDDEDDEWEFASVKDLFDDEEDFNSHYYESYWIFDKDEVESNRTMFKNWAETFLTEDLKDYGIEGADVTYADELAAVQKLIDSEDDCDVMYLDYLGYTESILNKEAEVLSTKEPASYSDIIRLQTKLTDVFYQYKKADYSSNKWDKMYEIYEEYMYGAEEFLYQVQINDEYVAKMKEKMDKVPVLAKELKQLKTKRSKQLMTLAKKSKYNQKKSIPLAKEGIKKIKKATTIKEVEKIFKTYKKKIEKTKK